MNDYRQSLRDVGIVLIIVGFLDIGWMIYSIASGESYSSSFNIFAVIAGILLFRGGLRTASVVAFFSAFMLSGCIGVLLVLPLILPFDLTLAYLRVYPASFGSYLLLAVFFLVLLGWIYSRLSAPLVKAAIAEKYPNYGSLWRRPRNGFLVGALLVVVLALALSFMLHGASAQRACAEAKLKVGEGYKFCVSSLSMQSSGGRTHVAAFVTAYNQTEIKKVEVDWDE
ncbi:MAG: hypothetical protein ABSE48_14465 [Verrucomicrobiota bacterium]